MSLLRRETFVCVDCETTGLDTEKDLIIEVGAIRFTFDHIIDRFESLIDPGVPIPEESRKIHHISDEMVAGKPKIEEVLPELLKFLEEGLVIGHNILFDLKMIDAAAKRANIPSSLQPRKQIDTLRLARLYGESPINSLEGLREHFNIAPEAAHRALDDAFVNMEVFKRLSERFKTTEQVFEKLKKPIELKAFPFGKHRGRPFKEVPASYMGWALHKLDLDEDLRHSMTQELRRRKSKGPKRFGEGDSPFSEL